MGTLTLTLAASISGTVREWDWTSSFEFRDVTWKALKFRGSGRLRALELSPSLAFGLQRITFFELTVP